VGCCFQNLEIQEKRKQTSFKKYGIEFPNNSKESKKKENKLV